MNYGILAKAEEMGVDAKYALTCRKRYLAGEIFDLEMQIASFDSDTENDHLNWIRELAAIDEIKQMAVIRREIKWLDRALTRCTQDDITPEMIQRAKAFPIDQLIPFVKGVALAWCHPDKRPSLTHDRKRNKAKCWPCDKAFDSIDVLVDRDGMNFKDAVKRLAS